MEETPEDIKLNRNSNCYTMVVKNPARWEKILETVFWNPADDPTITIQWIKDEVDKVLIHYEEKSNNFKIHMTLWTNGTFMVQGKQKSLEVWRNERFPTMEEHYLNPTLPTESIIPTTINKPHHFSTPQKPSINENSTTEVKHKQNVSNVLETPGKINHSSFIEDVFAISHSCEDTDITIKPSLLCTPLILNTSISTSIENRDRSSVFDSSSTSLCTQLEIVSPAVVDTKDNKEGDTCLENNDTLVPDTDYVTTDNENNTNITTNNSNNKTRQDKTRQDDLLPINENLQRPVNTAGQTFEHKYRKL